ncbi:hypothetical protein EVG20_g7209 [Dentipellis fragilis]|uniref:Protein-S-isoprenylcysteine O-methyltransferase n=1 Tax=Dentipellis fragilis TaxID=205917 RepID=A0A4Y9YJA6_9AGAM|nr:hypothetical protein EVG20_g7209 [Dentipellis fragilis]
MASLLKLPLLLTGSTLVWKSLTPPEIPKSEERVKLEGIEKVVGPHVTALAFICKANYTLSCICEALLIVASNAPGSAISQRILAILEHKRGGSKNIQITSPFLTGTALTVAGAVLRLLCYRIMGKMFTFQLALRDEHKLVTDGPYSIVRHPSYTGVILGSIGITLIHFGSGSWFKECGWLDTTVGRRYYQYWVAMRTLEMLNLFGRTVAEDKFLKAQFKDAWVRVLESTNLVSRSKKFASAVKLDPQNLTIEILAILSLWEDVDRGLGGLAAATAVLDKCGPLKEADNAALSRPLPMASLLKLPLLLTGSTLVWKSFTPPETPKSGEKVKLEGIERVVGRHVLALAFICKANYTLSCICEALLIVASNAPNSAISQRILAIFEHKQGGSKNIQITSPFLTGTALAVAGAVLRLLCYRIMGKMFTFQLALRDEHKLVRDGPYSIVRHPSYTGLILKCMGLLLIHFGSGSWFKECGWLETTAGRRYYQYWVVMRTLEVLNLFGRTVSEDNFLKAQFKDAWVRPTGLHTSIKEDLRMHPWPSPSPHLNMVLTNSNDFSATAFDYLIVGAGPAGLTLAARLAEDENIVVGILEAGDYNTNEPLIDVPGMVARSLGHPTLDWGYKTVPQAGANNRVISQARGKAIGGSTAINFMKNDRASAKEYDAIEELGNPGWNWKEFLKYIKKSETFTIPPKDVVEKYYAGYTHEFHGHDGPVQKSFPVWYNELHHPFLDTLVKLGASLSREAGGGINSGALTSTFTIDPRTKTRSYAATAYYEPNVHKKNFVVITGAHATRVLLETGADGEVVATGVEFIKDGEKVTARASREVILSAGSYQTPQLLELSGIGRRDVLEKHGIEQVVDLPSVGENLRALVLHGAIFFILSDTQDHCYIPFAFEVNKDIETYECLADPGRMAHEAKLYETEKRGMLSSMFSAIAFTPLDVMTDPEEFARLQKAVDNDTSLLSNPTHAKQYPYLRKWLSDPTHAQLEYVQLPGLYPWGTLKPAEGAHYQTFLVIKLHPYSRGSVHITTSDPLVPPAIDPAYFSNPIDLDLMVDAIKFSRKIASTEPYYREGMKFLDPSVEVLDDDEALREWVKNTVETIFHPIATASMLPKSDGGVVDPNLKVYGTKNLRVVDASIIPLHQSCHPTATVYGIAEKAADIIKAAQV